VHYLEDDVLGSRRHRLGIHLRSLRRNPARYTRTLAVALSRPALAAGYANCSTIRCFGHAVHVSEALAQMRDEGHAPTHVHAHFAHDPALIGMLVSKLTDLPFSFTGHARDLLQIPAKSLAARAARATALVTCCEVNAEYVVGAVPAVVRPPVLVVHHGIELDRFKPTRRRTDTPVPTILSVGRLVDKKGFDVLLQALALLRIDGFRFTCRIYGEGPLLEELTGLRDDVGLATTVHFMGARSSDDILAALHEADVFALTPRETADGDRDGIPNVLVEAMACGLPVVTTSVGGVPELVEHEVNGLRVESGDVASVAAALGTLLRDPQRRLRLGVAARERVEANHDVDAAAGRLARLFAQRSSRGMEVSQ
jgi:glycosyltransferase involved in cell wall biosynthesis